MSSVFSVLSDAQAGMFRMQQAKKPWEKDLEAKDAQGQLAQKAQRAAGSLSLNQQQLRGHAAARAALEEAQRVGGPKAAAEQRLERVERKIQEIKLAMQHARGDPQKMAQLAAEAGRLAKEAGRAAKEFGVGVANAAAMGLPGGAGTSSGTEITQTRTVTTLTIQQTEVSVSLTIKLDSGADAASPATTPDAAVATADAAAGAASARALGAGLAEGEAAASAPPAGGDSAPPAGSEGLPPELARMVGGALSSLSQGDGLTGSGDRGDRARALMRSLMSDNDLKMSRYKEADAFGRRVEDVLHVAKTVLGEAKVANALDEFEKRRKERREGFKAIEKTIDAAQKEVDTLRQAAFGSSTDAAALLSGSDDTASEGDDGEASMPVWRRSPGWTAPGPVPGRAL